MDLSGILVLVMAWRFVVCCVVSGLLAYLLHQAAPTLTFVHLIGITALGLVVGAEWQSLSTPSQWARRTRNFETHPLVTAFFTAIAGAVWGFFNAASLKDFAVGLLVFSISSIAWRSFFLREGLAESVANKCVAISGAALLAGAALARNVL